MPKNSKKLKDYVVETTYGNFLIKRTVKAVNENRAMDLMRDIVVNELEDIGIHYTEGTEIADQLVYDIKLVE